MSRRVSWHGIIGSLASREDELALKRKVTEKQQPFRDHLRNDYVQAKLRMHELDHAVRDYAHHRNQCDELRELQAPGNVRVEDKFAGEREIHQYPRCPAKDLGRGQTVTLE